MPITSPAALNSGPPELPWLMAASVWIAPGMANPVPLDSERLMADTTPTDSEPASRNGLPMAATGSPTRTREELPRGTGCSFSPSALTRSTATSANRS